MRPVTPQVRRARFGSTLAACALVALLLGTGHPSIFAQTASEHWVGTWATAEVGRQQNPAPPGPPGPPPFMPNSCPPARGAQAAPAAANAGAQRGEAPAARVGPQPFTHFTNQTLREIVHTSVGGAKARVVLSNFYGSAPLTVGAAHIAIRDKDAAIQKASDRPLMFSGRPTVTIPVSAVVYSDPVDLSVPQMADLAIDLYLPETTNTPSPLTIHSTAVQTNYISETGNHVGEAALPTVSKIQNWFLLSRVEVVAPDSVAGIVAFGDSITDGTRSTPDTNNRWPDQLMRRAAAQAGAPKLAIMNGAISGNQVLGQGAFAAANINALSRFDLNALSYAGVTHIIVLEGTNDIGQARQNPTPTAEDIIAGYKQLITRAHAKGIKIYGATLNPFYGAAYYTEVGEAKRQALNNWIRTSNAYDAVIDFDKATRDPADPKKYLAAYDSCDHLHPNDAGYKAMADSIDLSLFKVAGTAPRTSSSQ